ncbi:MAG: hypothetical protein A3F54_02925 [Candidatus Kerfeldbacteria bacterium RIFCSPHIGHO2_12_FULL_48_17]|uniref:Penicillin-binding protein 2 n=1 Tax=Candidatus Kerfeldbacteria bacterium RIFCSPHIGHO2_12_FULL_48_17 TaxID=1798542 RepID=A0A1G2BAN3_9BACT|nr:MAG: hypothetical protein A3F54_02925 [Candidatus Kerfeldbacteria bacterium RIFCSPHIGHO2_12_FULL_48_17]
MKHAVSFRSRKGQPTRPSAGKKWNLNNINRLATLQGVFFIGFAAIILRLFTVMILQHDEYKVLAKGQHEIDQILEPDRGLIRIEDPHSREGTYIIADNQERDLVYAVPKQIKDPKAATEKLAPLLAMDPAQLFAKLSQPESQYKPLLHKASEAQVNAIKALNIEGIAYTKESWRFYPEKSITSHLTGFVGFDENDAKIGQYGIEQYFNEELGGKPGWLQTERDGAGRWITVGERLIEPAQDGYDIVLTIDKNIQFSACNTLKEAVDKHGAKKGTVMVMDPHTGAIKAMCNYPDFDANNYQEAEDLEHYINSAVSEEWEPGSVFKTFTLGAALDQGKISPSTVYHDSGCIRVANYPAPICNSDRKTQNRDVDMNFVMAESLNTGSIYAQQQIGNETWYNYLKNWGFGEPTGIEMAGENRGSIANIGELKDIYAATSTFGQGLQVTPIQLLTAFASVANGGALMKPYIVDKIVLDNGYEVKTEPEKVRQVISAQTAKTLSAMLVNVVENGHAKRAGLPGYFIAGKTGTAQIARTDGRGYDSNKHNDVFVGFGPASSDPQFIMLTKINEPKDVSWAEGSAVPLFGKIADWLVDYMEIPPDRPTDQ